MPAKTGFTMCIVIGYHFMPAKAGFVNARDDGVVLCPQRRDCFMPAKTGLFNAREQRNLCYAREDGIA